MKIVVHSLVIALGMGAAWFASHALLLALGEAAPRLVMIGAMVVVAVVAGSAASRLTPPAPPPLALGTFVLVPLAYAALSRAIWVSDAAPALRAMPLLGASLSVAGFGFLFVWSGIFFAAYVGANRAARALAGTHR